MPTSAPRLVVQLPNGGRCSGGSGISAVIRVFDNHDFDDNDRFSQYTEWRGRRLILSVITHSNCSPCLISRKEPLHEPVSFDSS